MKKSKPGPHNKDKQKCSKGHPYDGDNLLTYTSKSGQVRRICRTCALKKAKVYYWKRVKKVKHPRKPGRPRKDKSRKERHA